MDHVGGAFSRNEKYLWTGLILLQLGFIYHNSLTPAVLSAQQSGNVLMLLKSVLGRIGLDGPWLTDHVVRKLAHFAEFSLLGLLLWNCLRSWNPPMSLRVTAEAFLSLFLPFVDETLQMFSEGRSAQVDDVWLDVSGICFGTLCMAVLWMLIGVWRSRRIRRGTS